MQGLIIKGKQPKIPELISKLSLQDHDSTHKVFEDAFGIFFKLSVLYLKNMDKRKLEFYNEEYAYLNRMAVMKNHRLEYKDYKQIINGLCESSNESIGNELIKDINCLLALLSSIETKSQRLEKLEASLKDTLEYLTHEWKCISKFTLVHPYHYIYPVPRSI